MSNAVLKGHASGTGTVTLETPNTNSDRTISLPDSNGTVMVSGNMPAFSVTLAGTVSLTTAVFTKVAYDTKVFDTNSNFASGKFTPTVAGYYQFNGGTASTGAPQEVLCALYKNGGAYNYGTDNSLGNSYVSTLVYMNGTTDYVEIYAYSANTRNASVSSLYTYFNGCLVRAA